MNGTAAQRYAALQSARQHYIKRAERHARLTIPALFVEEGFKSTSDLYTPYQSVGARGVNNLASKLLLTLFPPNASFFKLSVDELTVAKMAGEKGMKAQVDEGLAVIERVILQTVEASALRTSVFEALKQLLVAGNVSFYAPKPDEIRVFRLNQYVVKRSPHGQVVEAVVCEEIDEAALPQPALEALKLGKVFGQPALPSDKKPQPQSTNAGEAAQSCSHKVYTHIKLVDGKHEVYQEIEGVVIQGSNGSYRVEHSPWLFLRFMKIDGEDYGRSYVEEYYGDLFTLEELMKTITDGAAILSKIVHLCDPAGSTDPDELSKAETGDFITGNARDITTLQVEKAYDLQWVKGVADTIAERLAFAFLMNSAIQRAGERVTAEEIRYMARELEDVLGGVYSIQSQEFQLPLTRRLIHSLTAANRIPKLPKDIQPSITTGYESLGRGHDLDKLDLLIGGALKTFGEQVLGTINVKNYLMRRATALSIDTAGLFKTDDELAQEQQAAQLAAMSPDLIRGGTQIATKAMEQQAPDGK